MVNSIQSYTDVFHKFIKTLGNKAEKQVAKDVLTRQVEYNGSQIELREAIEQALNEGLNLHCNVPINISKSGYFLGVAGDCDLQLNKTGYLYAKYLIEENFFRGRLVVDYSVFIEEREKNFKEWANDLNKVKFFHILTHEDNFGSLASLITYLKGLIDKPEDYVDIFAVYDISTKVLDLFDADSVKSLGSTNKVVFQNIISNLVGLYQSGELDYTPDGDYMKVIDRINNNFIYYVNETADSFAEEKSRID